MRVSDAQAACEQHLVLQPGEPWASPCSNMMSLGLRPSTQATESYTS